MTRDASQSATHGVTASISVGAEGVSASRKTAVSYVRVSTKEQAERDGDPDGYSLPAQLEANRRKAETKGAIVVEEFIERGESAKFADSRPELQRMLAYLQVNPVDYVIVHKVDRLARNRLDDAQIHMVIKKAGAELVSSTENIDETPSGMLLHGIMSSIAEFYSRNLANEVVKGMEQKAKTGGTPGKAPLGYRNVRLVTEDGREVRTVEIDPLRAHLITWAFTAYATGDWTLSRMAAELERRGLTTRSTPRLPGGPLRQNSLHKILTTPYYKGEVTYRGARYPGRHQALIDEATWERVQDVLSSHATGEKQRTHPHYLRSSVFCGSCGSRLIVTMSKNKSGTVYPYFICIGRHQKRTHCTQRAVLISTVERLVEEEYQATHLDPKSRDEIEAVLTEELRLERQTAESASRDLRAQKERLVEERTRLLQAHYAGAIPLDLLKSEQDRITRQLASVNERLSAASAEFDKIEGALRTGLDYAVNCSKGYLQARHRERRLFNQAFFSKIFVHDDSIEVELAEPFRTLLGVAKPRVAPVRSVVRALEASGEPLTDVLRRDKNKLAPSDASLKLTALVPPA